MSSFCKVGYGGVDEAVKVVGAAITAFEEMQKTEYSKLSAAPG